MITPLILTKTLWRFNEVLFSPCCLVCKSYSLQTLCHRCELPETIRNSKHNRCNLCFERILNGTLCQICETLPPFYTKARFLWEYTGNPRDFCVTLKYKPSLKLINLAAKKLSQEIPLLFSTCEWDYLIPVPASRAGIKMRGFNHVELLAQRIKAELKLNTRIINALEHKTNRRPQASLSNIARLKGMKRRYAVTETAYKQLNSKSALLLDDVTTTGATLNAAIEALKVCALSRLDVLTICRSPTWFMYRN